MAESLLGSISTTGEIITNKWANGALGKIVDIKNDGNFRFVDYRIGEDGLLKKCHAWEADEMACPIVATGFVGYWLHNQHLTFTEAYKSYYERTLAEYQIKCQADIDLCDQDYTRDFITYKHIIAERKAIKISEAICLYLTADDAKKIKKLTDKYLAYARKRRNEYYASRYPKNEVIERSFLSHFEPLGAACQCVEWLRTEFNLPNMGPHWHTNRKTEKEQLEGVWKYRHEVEIPINVREDLEDFDESIMYINGGLMEEIQENLKSYTTQEDRVRYITSLVTPFKEFALPFHPNAQVAERERAIKETEKSLKDWEGVAEDEVDSRTGEPLNPKEQIEACKDFIERYENDIEYWYSLQSRFFSFSQPGTSELRPEENIEMCKHLRYWSHYMHSFAHRLAALALTYGINLMDIQETCGVYIVRQLSIIDYVDEHYIKDYQHAQKLLDKIKKDKGMTNLQRTAQQLAARMDEAEIEFNAKYPMRDIDADKPALTKIQFDILDYLSIQSAEVDSLIGVKELRLNTSLEIALACRELEHSGLISAFIDGDYENEQLGTSALSITDKGRIVLRKLLTRSTQNKEQKSDTSKSKRNKKDKHTSTSDTTTKSEKQHGVDYPVFAKGPRVTEDHIKAMYRILTSRSWISTQTTQAEFLRLFSGVSNSCEIIWLGQDKQGSNSPTQLGIAALYVLFKKLIEEKLISTSNKGSLGPVLESHFVDSTNHYLTSVSNSTNASKKANEVIQFIIRTLKTQPNAEDVQKLLKEDMQEKIDKSYV